MGLFKEIVAQCDLCSRKERFDGAGTIREAQTVALEKGWYVKKKNTMVEFVICDKCRNEVKG